MNLTYRSPDKRLQAAWPDKYQHIAVKDMALSDYDAHRLETEALIGAGYVTAGMGIVVSCYNAFNRSNLMAGLVMRHLGLSGDEAVERIRRVRGPVALKNKSFEDYLRGG